MKKIILASVLSLLACSSKQVQTVGTTFQDDVAFLQKHTPVVVLATKSNLAMVEITPALQGRIMTSNYGGNEGPSFGL